MTHALRALASTARALPVRENARFDLQLRESARFDLQFRAPWAKRELPGREFAAGSCNAELAEVYP